MSFIFSFAGKPTLATDTLHLYYEKFKFRLEPFGHVGPSSVIASKRLPARCFTAAGAMEAECIGPERWSDVEKEIAAPAVPGAAAGERYRTNVHVAVAERSDAGRAEAGGPGRGMLRTDTRQLAV